ncbi:aegerolysin family protein [Bacillus wiedmannii]|uniref:aegerolysin family protein n=1 Tax=Bacillus wiedmannii TaxID=1890302 RepID=UPI0015CF8083|nr:aegerolysin family protein [Bacillus wiedmannii]
MGIISDISGVGSAINTVKSVIEGFNTARSVILEIANNTDLTLTKVSEDISHGGWAVTPQGQIPPQKALVFGAQSSGGSLFTGTEGSITYTGDGIQLTAYWDNPWAGNNSCDLKLTGPKAGNYKINKECGAGNTNAHMRYELFPSTTTTPQTKKNKSYSSGSISAVARIPDSMEVWWIGANGSVQDAFWYAGQQWKRFELASTNSASSNGSITAVSRIPDSMEVWWIGANGSVQGAFWYAGQQWKRYELAPAGSASLTAGITAVSRIPDSMEVWWIGANGSVQGAFWYAGQQWKRYEISASR